MDSIDDGRQLGASSSDLRRASPVLNQPAEMVHRATVAAPVYFGIP